MLNLLGMSLRPLILTANQKAQIRLGSRKEGVVVTLRRRQATDLRGVKSAKALAAGVATRTSYSQWLAPFTLWLWDAR